MRTLIDQDPTPKDGTENLVAWKPARSVQPKTSINTWSKPVVAVTNFHNVYKLCCFVGEDAWVWQRTAQFEDGEYVTKWTPLP